VSWIWLPPRRARLALADDLGPAEITASTLRQMRGEAEETERRCTDLASERDGKKTAIFERPRKPRVQERHFSDTKDCSLQLAGENDPYEHTKSPDERV
jgi:hypothetical protein